MSRTHKGLNELFDVEGEIAKGPRDTSLSAKQRVNCHCTTVPVVDPNILGLSAEEKNAIQQGAAEAFD